MAFWMLATAGAAGLSGSLFGEKFSADAGVGITDPSQPGVVTVVIASVPLTCENVRATITPKVPKGNKKPKKKDAGPNLILATFSDPAAGLVSTQTLIFGAKGMGGLGGTVTLGTMPADVGAEGRVTVALTAIPAAKEGAFGGMIATSDTDAVSGEIPFTLCDPITERPSLAETAFEQRSVKIADPSPGGDPLELTVSVALPVGWTEGTDALGAPQWNAPDGTTNLAINLSSRDEDFLTSMAAHAKMQADAFVGEGTSGELVFGEARGDGTYVARWRYRWGDGEWTNQVDVFRQDAGWPVLVKCSAKGQDRALAEVFPALEKSCVELTSAP